MEYRAPDINQMNANGTHYCLLAAIVHQTTGSVVELGVGHYSTPMLHFMCQNREVVSIETNAEWHNYFSSLFAKGSHKFEFTNENLISNVLKNYTRKWDVAFVDHGPEQDRPRCVELLRNRAKYIVVHDSEPNAVAYGWNGIFDTFKYKYYWDFYGNGTTIVSETEEIRLI